MKKIFSLLILLAILIPLAACGGQKPESGETIPGTDKTVPEERQYSFWIRTGDTHYNDYEENPGIEYLESQPYGTDEKGNPKYLDLSFYIPVTGSEQDNFNTLIATGDYMDVMTLTASTFSPIELYEQGIAMDITEYVEQYMPHYLEFLEQFPDLKATATNLIDGEKRFLVLYNYGSGIQEMWGGYQYRRDWIVKYGKNPLDGSAFSGSFTVTNTDGTVDLDSWEDNVVFPSGGPDPVYISDWEWMFGIFDLALEDLGITDGYGMSLYYPGYLATGDLVSAFGGGGPMWYKTPDLEVKFGMTSDDFRTYLQAMHTWYKNGWIDKAFPEHNSDIFYTIDNTRIFSGKVGLWWGTQATLGGSLSNPDDPLLKDFVSFSAPQPINDVYGSEAQQNKVPYTFYQISQAAGTSMVTTAAQDKDLVTLFTFLDSLYDPGSNAVIFSFGLNQEQYEQTKNKFMTDNGFTRGVYYPVEENGETLYELYPEVADTGMLASLRPHRLPGLDLQSTMMSSGSYKPGVVSNLDRWTQYPNTGWIENFSQLSIEDMNAYNKIQTYINEFSTKNVPPFIKGEKDPFNDEDWNSFVKALNKYNPDKATAIIQDMIDLLYGK